MNKSRATPLTRNNPTTTAFQLALNTLAVDAIQLGVGGRLPTIAHYQKKLDIGAGTMHKALDFFSASGTLITESHGHQGRQIARVNLGKLWRIANLGRIRIALPPPGPIEVWSASECLRQTFTNLDIPFDLIYQPGSKARTDLLSTSQVDAAFFSTEAGRQAQKELTSKYQAVPLGPNTYYANHSVGVLIRNELKGEIHARKDLRIGIDRGSSDNVRITQTEFPESEGYRHIQVDFLRFPLTVLLKEVDALVWHKMLLLIPLEKIGLTMEPLSRESSKREVEAIAEAVLLCGPHRPEVKALLKSIEPSSFLTYQEKVSTSEGIHAVYPSHVWIM